MTRWPSVSSQPAAPRCVSRTSAPGPLRFTRARAMTASAAAAGAALARLDQLDPDVVGRPHERDARPVRDLDGPLQEASAQALEPLDVGLEVRGVEPEVLEPVVGARVPRPEALARARTRDVHAHSAVLALAADEAVAEDARLVAHDLEVEGPHVPLRGLPRVGRLQVDVVDAERHDAPPLEGAPRPRGPSPRRPAARTSVLLECGPGTRIYTLSGGAEDGTARRTDSAHHRPGARHRRLLRQDLIAGSELRGKLIQTASIASYGGGNHLTTPYSAAKAGVVSLTRSAAQALAGERITSNGVCPGAVETAMWEQIDRELGA